MKGVAMRGSGSLIFGLMFLMGFFVAIDAATNAPVNGSTSAALPDATNPALAKALAKLADATREVAALTVTKSDSKELPQSNVGFLDVLAQNSECRRFLDEINAVKKDLIGGLRAKSHLDKNKITIFVPNDEAMNAFGKVGKLHRKKLRWDEKQQRLGPLFSFVGYHFILGAISHSDLKDERKKVKTVTGRSFALGHIAQTVLYSVNTPHAVIHVVNRVLVDPASDGLKKEILPLPAPKQLVTSLDALEKFAECSRFLAEIKNVKQDTLLTQQRLMGGDRTLFIPTNSAMETFGKVDLLRKDKPGENALPSSLLMKFVNYHIVQGIITVVALRNGQSSVKTTSNNKEFRLSEVNQSVIYSIETGDSITHVINKVLINPELKANLGN